MMTSKQFEIVNVVWSGNGIFMVNMNVIFRQWMKNNLLYNERPDSIAIVLFPVLPPLPEGAIFCAERSCCILSFVYSVFMVSQKSNAKRMVKKRKYVVTA